MENWRPALCKYFVNFQPSDSNFLEAKRRLALNSGLGHVFAMGSKMQILIRSHFPWAFTSIWFPVWLITHQGQFSAIHYPHQMYQYPSELSCNYFSHTFGICYNQYTNSLFPCFISQPKYACIKTPFCSSLGGAVSDPNSPRTQMDALAGVAAQRCHRHCCHRMFKAAAQVFLVASP